MLDREKQAFCELSHWQDQILLDMFVSAGFTELYRDYYTGLNGFVRVAQSNRWDWPILGYRKSKEIEAYMKSIVKA